MAAHCDFSALELLLKVLLFFLSYNLQEATFLEKNP